jgi:hypothetical protein
MNLQDLEHLMDQVRESCFRLESLPQYLVPQEAAEFAAWRAGSPRQRRTPQNNAWLAELEQIVARGIRWYRVRILDHPLTDYSRFELAGYRDTQAAGQQTYVADRRDHEQLADLQEDFWLLDDRTAVRMVYDDDGHFVHPEPVDDVTRYVRMRDTAMACAEPLPDYLARTQVRLTT